MDSVINAAEHDRLRNEVEGLRDELRELRKVTVALTSYLSGVDLVRRHDLPPGLRVRLEADILEVRPRLRAMLQQMHDGEVADSLLRDL